MFFISLTKYISMVTTIICVFLWIPDILKENVFVVWICSKSYFLAIAGMLLTRKVDENYPNF